MEALPSDQSGEPPEIRVGIREMRHEFRAWLERVRNGQRIVITDRGEPIVDLVPHDPTRTWLDHMYESGQVVVASAGPAHWLD
jgi:prevent-host-death family protein